jgi:glucokinase
MAPYGGIDLGGTKIQAAVLDARNRMLGSARLPTPTAGGPADVAAEMERALREAADAARIKTEALAGVGVGSPGTVGVDGTVTSARNLPGWEGSFPLGPELARALGCEVRVGNDVQVATVAEFRLGAGRPFKSVLGLFWGTGVGGGVILDGEVWRGRGGAGEIGHMVVRIGGARCTCGRRGCVEAYAGRAAMERRVRDRVDKGHKTDLFKIAEEHGRPRLTSGVWSRALEHGDALAGQMIERAVGALAAGAASAVNLLDVEAVIIGGGLGIRLGAAYAERIASAMVPHLFNDARPPHVEVAALGDLGGAVGAALLVEPLGKPRPRSRGTRARPAQARAPRRPRP